MRQHERDRQIDLFPPVRLPTPLTQCGYSGSIKCGKPSGLDDGDASYRAGLQVKQQVETTDAHMVLCPVSVRVLWRDCLHTIVEPRSGLSTEDAMTDAFGIDSARGLALAQKCFTALRSQGTKHDGICAKSADNERAQAHLTRKR